MENGPQPKRDHAVTNSQKLANQIKSVGIVSIIFGAAFFLLGAARLSLGIAVFQSGGYLLLGLIYIASGIAIRQNPGKSPRLIKALLWLSVIVVVLSILFVGTTYGFFFLLYVWMLGSTLKKISSHAATVLRN
jgi:hypothetical protein